MATERHRPRLVSLIQQRLCGNLAHFLNSHGTLEFITRSLDKNELAGERTDLAEDRTVLANERTFAGWMRTGLAAVGIGLGFNALFGKMDPRWLPKAIVTCFIISGIVIFYLAERNSCSVLERLDAHSVQPLRRMNLRLVASLMGIGSTVLLGGMWFLL